MKSNNVQDGASVVKLHANEVHVHEVHAHKVRAMRYTLVRCTPDVMAMR